MSEFHLRAHEKEDALAVAKLLMRPKVRYQTMVFGPYTSDAEARAFMEAPVNGLNIVAESDHDRQMIGHVVLFRGTKFKSHIGSIGIAVHDEWHRRGVGNALLEAAVDTAERWLGLSRITLEVFVDNEPAIALYKKFGFEIEGTLRRHLAREGVPTDCYAMARLKS